MEMDGQPSSPDTESKKAEYEEREYQTYLFERAKEQNVIICLPTGCGKTFIAVQIVKHYLNEATRKDKKIIFVAPTVPLVFQQGKYLDEHIASSYSSSECYVGIVTGDQKPELWDGSKWADILSKQYVFSMTDEVLRKAVDEGSIRWEKISLLIVDECHNGTGGHPMSQLMESYRRALTDGGGVIGETLPRVVGLTATIIKGKSKLEKVEVDIKAVERKFCSVALTYHQYEDVIRCATSANIEAVSYSEDNKCTVLDLDLEGVIGEKFTLVDMLQDILTNLKYFKEHTPRSSGVVGQISDPTLRHQSQLMHKQSHPIADCIKDIEDIQVVLEELGLHCTKNAVLMKQAIFRFKAKRYGAGTLNGCSAESALQFTRTRLDLFERDLDGYIDRATQNNERHNFAFHKGLVSPKLQCLIDILVSRRNHIPICGIVFTNRRIIAQMITFYIEDLGDISPESYGFLKCDFVLGTSGNTDTTITSALMKHQTRVLDDFHQKKINVLVATKVLEEGLNVPSCNFIVRFDTILTHSSYVQSMGRARQRDAKFYVLVPKTTAQEETRKIDNYRDFNQCLTWALKEKVEKTERFYNVDIEMDESELNRLVPPFRPGGGPQQITASSAIQTVYQYCQILVCDKFTTLSPVAWFIPMEQGYKVKVKLPPNACVKGAESKVYNNKIVAKKAAFLEVCKMLYEAGALYPVTLIPIPPGIKNFKCDFLNELEMQIEKDGLDRKSVGTKQHVVWYPRAIPALLCQKDVPKEQFVYALEMRLEETAFFGYQKQKPKSMFEFHTHQYLFGVVTSADLSKVPDFLVFSRDGNFLVHLEKVSIGLNDGGRAKFSTGDMEALQLFQSFVFFDTQLLDLHHPVFKASTTHPYYIAPLKRGDNGGKCFEVAFDVITRMSNCQNVNYDAELSLPDRRQMSFEGENLIGCLVIPSYEPPNNKKQNYCVFSYKTDITPMSAFPDPQYTSYFHYYQRKYAIQLALPKGPILKGQPVSNQLNFLVPKYDNETMKSKKDANERSSSVLLMRELVRVHPLPATLYMQLKMLPSCLHRISRLLLANEIRESVSEEFQDHLGKDSELLQKRQEDELRQLNSDTVNYFRETMKNRQVARSETKQEPGVQGPKLLVENLTGRVFKAVVRRPSKSKLRLVDIKLKHPRKLQEEDFDVSEDEDESDDDDMDIDLPAITLGAKQCNIKLIHPKDVPFQNLHRNSSIAMTGGPLPSTIMEALTLANGRDSVSLEKLEMIGDSVLKLTATLHIFCHFPDWDEGALTALRTQLISNRHLFLLGSKKNLGSILAVSLFQPETGWLPPGMEIPHKLIKFAVENGVNYSVYGSLNSDPLRNLDYSAMTDKEIETFVRVRVQNKDCVEEMQSKGPTNTSYTHSRVGDKSIADCVEALIGAYYLDSGLNGALELMKWMGLRGPTLEPSSSIPYEEIEKLPRVTTAYPTEEQEAIPFLSDIEKLLEYRFRNKWLVVEAFTHASYTKKDCKTNAYQRLEFLGDAVLDFLVTDFIYKTKRAETPGKLTDLRSALVNNVTFGSLVVRYGLHLHLLHFSPDLQEAIDKFAAFQARNGHQINENFELLSGEGDCLVAEDVDVPKALGDIFESLAGAVFIDSGMNLDTVFKVFYRLMKHEIDVFSLDIPLNPVRKLYEKYPERVKFRPWPSNENSDTKVVSVEITGVDGTFHGSGPTTKNAKEAAAKYALKSLQ